MKIPGSLHEKTIEEQRARTSALVALTGQDIPRVFHRQGNRIRDPSSTAINHHPKAFPAPHQRDDRS